MHESSCLKYKGGVSPKVHNECLFDIIAYEICKCWPNSCAALGRSDSDHRDHHRNDNGKGLSHALICSDLTWLDYGQEDKRLLPRESMKLCGIYLGLRVVIWEPLCVVVSHIRGPQYKPQYLTILIIGTPKKVPLTVGTPHILSIGYEPTLTPLGLYRSIGFLSQVALVSHTPKP